MRKIFIALFMVLKDLISFILAMVAIFYVGYTLTLIISSFSVKSILIGMFIVGFICMWIYNIIKAG